jgi:hypothetical protein
MTMRSARPALPLLLTLLGSACAQQGNDASPGNDAGVIEDSAAPTPDAKTGDSSSTQEASSDTGTPTADAASDTGSTVADAETADAAAECVHAGNQATNSYSQSCTGCSVGVIGQHCFLTCSNCNGTSGGPSSLVLPCDQPIANCCGVLTCGGCQPCS